jgi:GTP-binding protein
MSSFVDEVTLYAKAGDGGNGAVAWRREAHVAKGGPAGGDGGDGGDVVFVGDDGVHSLLDFKYEPRLMARNGQTGRGKNQAGHFGEDAVAKVPLGTQIFDADSGELLCDVVEHGQRFVVCHGGSGGFGNSRFATPSRQAPEFAKPGLAGEEKNLRLSLKLMADVGLLGFPNAGKSTFVARVSAARPKIADYPFTTLVPQLGVVRVPGTSKAEGKSFVIADIPGVIEGAAEGAGLGVRFLKHLERVRVLLHLVEVPLEVAEAAFDGTKVEASDIHDATRGPVDLVKRYDVLRRELSRFSDELAARPEIVALNKSDLLVGDPLALPAVKKLKKHLDKKGVPLLFLSGAAGVGVDSVLLQLWQRVQSEKAPTSTTTTDFDPARALR